MPENFEVPQEPFGKRKRKPPRGPYADGATPSERERLLHLPPLTKEDIANLVKALEAGLNSKRDTAEKEEAERPTLDELVQELRDNTARLKSPSQPSLPPLVSTLEGMEFTSQDRGKFAKEPQITERECSIFKSLLAKEENSPDWQNFINGLFAPLPQELCKKELHGKPEEIPKKTPPEQDSS